MTAQPVILVAEDNAALRKMLSLVLTRSGYAVVEAADGKRAVERARQGRPDLLLLDIHMPEMNGIEALRRIRARPETAATPAIILTAGSRRAEVVAAVQAGACDYIVKSGFDIKAFLARVRDLLGAADSWPGRSAHDAGGRPALEDRGPDARVTPPPAVAPAAPNAFLLRDAGNMPELVGHVPPLAPANVANQIRQITSVKALPFVMPQVMALTGSQYSSADSLVAAIEQDVALAGKVLAMANSSIYRRNRDPVTHLNQAVRNIGFGSVRQAAVGLAVMDLFQQGAADAAAAPGIDRMSFWEHCFASGSIARMLAARAGMDDSQGFVIGLLHNVGRLIQDEFFGEPFSGLLGFHDSDRLLPWDLERRWMGLEPEALAQAVMREWHMPEELSGPIGDHRRPIAVLLNRPEPHRRWAALVGLADLLATCLGFGDSRAACLSHLDKEQTDGFAVDDEFLRGLRDAVPLHIREMKLVMLVHIHRARWAERSCPVSDSPLAYFCPRPPHLDVIELFLRLRHAKFERFTDADAFARRLGQADPQTRAVVNLLPSPLIERSLAALDRLAAPVNGLVLARPEQAEQTNQLQGPFGHAFRGLLAPINVRQFERFLGLAPSRERGGQVASGQ